MLLVKSRRKAAFSFWRDKNLARLATVAASSNLNRFTNRLKFPTSYGHCQVAVSIRKINRKVEKKN
jgi:hypothetical protein